MAGRLLSWLSPEYRDTRAEKHTRLISPMRLKAANASCEPSFLPFFPLSCLRQTFACLPSQEGLQPWLWMGVEVCPASHSILII